MTIVTKGMGAIIKKTLKGTGKKTKGIKNFCIIIVQKK